MILDVDKPDPRNKDVKIYFNGELQHGVVRCDDEAGEITRIITDAVTGRPVVINGLIQYQTLLGTVVITCKD